MALSNRTEIFKFGYLEVLAALKHQDDKLNRWLTALSFLTAAGIAIYARALPSKSDNNTLPHSHEHVVAIFFVFFLVSVLAALIGVLGAIGPSGALPKLHSSSSANKSLIYFGKIAKESKSDWAEIGRCADDYLEFLLAKNLHDDILGLSTRVTYKMARAREAGAFSQLAILSLGLLGLFSIPSGEISMGGRWWVAAFVLGVMLVLPLWELLQMSIFQFPERRSFGWSYVAVSVIAFIGIELLCVAPHFHTYWIALLNALGAILGVRLAHVHGRFVPWILGLLGIAGVILWVMTFQA